MHKICPRCGASSAKKKFIGAFCSDCYPVNIEIPEKVEIWKCTLCGKVKDGEWKEEKNLDLERFVLKECRGDFASAHYDKKTGTAVFLLRKEDVFFEIRRNIPVFYLEKICEECSRASGGYYEAIIQLRGEEGEVKRLEEKLCEFLERETFVAKTISRKEGKDIYVGSRISASKALNALNLKYIRTEKLAGMREGRRLYRSTFCVRV